MISFGPLPIEDPDVGPYRTRVDIVLARKASNEADGIAPAQQLEQNAELAEWIHQLGGVIVAMKRDTVSFNDGDNLIGTIEGSWLVFGNDNHFQLYSDEEFNERFHVTDTVDEFMPKTYKVEAMQTAIDDIFGSRRLNLKQNMLVTKWLISHGAEMIGVTHNSLAFSKRDTYPVRYYECNVDPGHWIVLEEDGVFRLYDNLHFRDRYEHLKKDRYNGEAVV